MREGSILYQKTEYRKTYFVVDTTMEIKRNTLMEFKYLLSAFNILMIYNVERNIDFERKLVDSNLIQKLASLQVSRLKEFRCKKISVCRILDELPCQNDLHERP